MLMWNMIQLRSILIWRTLTLPDIKAPIDNPPMLTVTQPRASNNYLLRLSLLVNSNSICTNDSFLSIDNLASNKVGDDSDGFIERFAQKFGKNRLK